MAQRSSTCCFTGYRAQKLPWGFQEQDQRCRELKVRIWLALQEAYDAGYRHFLCGMAQGSDLYFCQETLLLRQRYGDVTLEAVVPCLGQDKNWPTEVRRQYRELLERCDVRTLLQREYTPQCMLQRNRYMVDHSSLLLAVFDGRSGGTAATVSYARHQGLRIVTLPPVM